MIVAQNLVKHFDECKAVDDISFQVEPGEIFGLLGPNGAGKTTAQRMMAGLLTPTSGAATIGGYDVRQNDCEAKKLLGFLSGDTGLYGRLTPIETLRYFGRLNHLDKKHIENRIELMIKQFEMQEFSTRRCEKLSTGQKQRVNLARTIFHDPPVLILDEPTAGLDIIANQFILKTLKSFRDQDKAIVFSTHYLVEAELLCNRIGLLHKGRLLAVGSLQQLKAQTGMNSLTDIYLHFLELSSLKENSVDAE